MSIVNILGWDDGGEESISEERSSCGCGSVLCRGHIQFEHADITALAGELQRNGFADTCGSTGDDGLFAMQSFHGFFLAVRVVRGNNGNPDTGVSIRGGRGLSSGLVLKHHTGREIILDGGNHAFADDPRAFRIGGRGRIGKADIHPPVIAGDRDRMAVAG